MWRKFVLLTLNNRWDDTFKNVVTVHILGVLHSAFSQSGCLANQVDRYTPSCKHTSSLQQQQ